MFGSVLIIRNLTCVLARLVIDKFWMDSTFLIWHVILTALIFAWNIVIHIENLLFAFYIKQLFKLALPCTIWLFCGLNLIQKNVLRWHFPISVLTKAPFIKWSMSVLNTISSMVKIGSTRLVLLFQSSLLHILTYLSWSTRASYFALNDATDLLSLDIFRYIDCRCIVCSVYFL